MRRDDVVESFENKVVAITGCATGVSLSFAKQFGREGAAIVMAGRREQSLRSAVDKLAGHAVGARYFVCDVSQRAAIDDFADFTWDAFGRVDVVVGNKKGAFVFIQQEQDAGTSLEDAVISAAAVRAKPILLT